MLRGNPSGTPTTVERPQPPVLERQDHWSSLMSRLTPVNRHGPRTCTLTRDQSMDRVWESEFSGESELLRATEKNLRHKLVV